MSLTIFQDTGNSNKNFVLMETSWAALLNPVLANPMSNGIFLTGINLINGVVTINHLLGKKMQGWLITDINAAATIFRTTAFNDKTLTLSCNATVTVNLYVF